MFCSRRWEETSILTLIIGVSRLILVFKLLFGWARVEPYTTRKTLIHGSIIYDAPRLGVPRISIHDAPRNMRHRFCLMRGVPNMRCITHMWAPMGTIAGGVRPPHPWRMISSCATHMAGICGAPASMRHRIQWAHPVEKVAGISMAHGS
jgi:hypothetical protein